MPPDVTDFIKMFIFVTAANAVDRVFTNVG